MGWKKVIVSVVGGSLGGYELCQWWEEVEEGMECGIPGVVGRGKEGYN